MSTPHLLDYAIIAAYLALMVAVGAACARLARNAGDYFRCGSRAAWWLVGTNLYMGAFSAWAFTGGAGVAYHAGASIFWVFGGSVLGYLLNVCWHARRFRQLRATTAPEAIALRFSAPTAQFYAWVGIVVALPFSAIALYGLAIFCSTVFAVDLTITLVAAGAVVVLYSTLGGSWAILATDFTQALIVVPLTLALAVACLVALGGFGGLADRISAAGLTGEFALVKAAGEFPRDAYTWGWAGALFLRNIFNEVSLPSAVRYFSVKDGRAATQAALFCLGLLVLGVATWFLPPVAARLLYAEEVRLVGAGLPKPAEAAYVVAGLHLLPTGFIGVMVVAMFAATMSGMDASLNRSAAVIVRDLIPLLRRRLGRPPLEDAAQLRTGRWVTLALGCILVVSALSFAADRGRGVFEVMTETGALLGTPMAVPMILALCIRRAPAWSALVAAGVGFGGSLCSTFSLPLFGTAWNVQTTIVVNFTASALAFLLSTLGWRQASPAYRAQVDAFFHRLNTPVAFAAEVGVPNDRRQLRLMARFTFVTALLIGALALAPHGTPTRIAIGAAAVGLAVVGVALARSAQNETAAVARDRV